MVLPLSAPAQKLNIPLIRALETKLNYADRALTLDLVRGMPIVGGIPRTAALPAKETLASIIIREVKGSLDVANEKILKSLSKSADTILKQK